MDHEEGYTPDELAKLRPLWQQRDAFRKARRLSAEFDGRRPIVERSFQFEREIKEPVTAPNVEYGDIPGRKFTAAMRTAENARRTLFRKGVDVPAYYDLMTEVHRTGSAPPALIELARKHGC